MSKTSHLYPEGTTMRRVIDFATKEFFAKGVKQVTMDDIAKGLQMSKRTLYQLFADKAQLIIACIEATREKERTLATSLILEGRNVLEIVLCIMEFRIKGLENVSRDYVRDVSKMESVMAFVKIVQEEAINRSVNFLQLGVAQGFFRNDIDFQLLTRSMLTQMDNAIVADEETDYTIEDVFINIGLIHLRGCCTTKGIELIDTFLEHYRSTHQPSVPHIQRT